MTTSQAAAAEIERRMELFPLMFLIRLNCPTKFRKILHAIEEIATTLEVPEEKVIKAVSDLQRIYP